MMTIREKQLAAFEAAALGDFENRLLSHVRKHFSDDCASLAETELRDTIEERIDLAKGYGFESEQHICAFINLTFAVGAEFHKLPWAKQVLHDKWIDSPSARMRQLADKAQTELSRTTAQKAGNHEL